VALAGAPAQARRPEPAAEVRAGAEADRRRDGGDGDPDCSQVLFVTTEDTKDTKIRILISLPAPLRPRETRDHKISNEHVPTRAARSPRKTRSAAASTAPAAARSTPA